MPYVVAALVLVGAVALLNLVFTMGVVRRLREHSELLAKPSGSKADDGLIPAGQIVDDFATRSVSGDLVSRADIERDTIVAFFSPHCQPCIEKVPQFVSYVAGLPRGRRQVIAVVAADEMFEAADMVGKLGPVATVVAAKDAKPMIDAFKTTGFPALYLMDDAGAVRAGGHSMSHLPGFVAA
ncbi:TlpA family protein disulfide reductase [Micromonospora carbonacea]|uniref:TlpA family protein disulfide reductase n=1 Tax=Micromonospora carbonacea TaxID=47853 RepID=UPI003D759193